MGAVKLEELLNLALTSSGTQIAAALYAKDFHLFIRDFFPIIEPSVDFCDNWHIDAISEHLMAVSRGEITRLIINIPPRHMKSILVSVMWNAWEWIDRPSLRYLHVSYSEGLSLRDSLKTIRIIRSPMYQKFFADRFSLVRSQAKKFENDQAGFRLASSIDGSNTGEGGERVMLDDPHNMRFVHSPTIRGSVIDTFDNVLMSRLNNAKRDAIILIMQRGHLEDLAGHLLSKGTYTHLMLPARFEIDRKCSTKVYWTNPKTGVREEFSDPREVDGELLWRERYDEPELSELEKALGSYGTAGQLQQRPNPAGGGLVNVGWFLRYTVAPARLTRVTFSIDCANKKKEVAAGKKSAGSAYNVVEVWGQDGSGIDYLLHVERFRAEYPDLRRRVVSMCIEWSPNDVLIEDKANGTALIQDLKKPDAVIQGLCSSLGKSGYRFPVIPIEPESDKITRMSAESSYIEAGNVSIPMVADWLPAFEDEIQSFPGSTYCDQVDTLSQYLMWKRTSSNYVGAGIVPVRGT